MVLAGSFKILLVSPVAMLLILHTPSVTGDARGPLVLLSHENPYLYCNPEAFKSSSDNRSEDTPQVA